MTNKIFSITLLLTMILSYSANAQYSLEVVIENLDNSGVLRLGIYNDPDNFLVREGLFEYCVADVEKNKVVCKWDSIPGGVYSLAYMNDLNGNEMMDTNFIGFPSEQYGFFPDPGFLLRVPRFEDCSFELKEDMQLTMTAK